jgi:AmpD protein|tara:strand:+ start:1956 stop:2591 length:636 start_codon:yes stop_codon:yes gene_type:complete
MTLKDLTKKIQRSVGSTADGIYGKNTAHAVIDALDNKTPVSKEKTATKKVDGNFEERIRPTPNKSSSKITPEGVVLHHSYGSYEGGVSWILNDTSNVSYHVLIDTDGKRTVFADDNERAWHAGKSEFKGRGGCNGFMLGVAFTNDTNSRELTDEEVASAVEYMVPRFKKWGWPEDLSTISTHREVSPGRKTDPDIRAETKVLDALKAHFNK